MHSLVQSFAFIYAKDCIVECKTLHMLMQNSCIVISENLPAYCRSNCSRRARRRVEPRRANQYMMGSTVRRNSIVINVP